MSVNRFDERAATWDDDPAKVERAHKIALAIREAIPLEPSMRMLEYGAGTGLVTQALRDAVGPVTMADTSAGMRAVMNDKIASGAITDARVWDLDLTTGPDPPRAVRPHRHRPDPAPHPDPGTGPGQLRHPSGRQGPPVHC